MTNQHQPLEHQEKLKQKKLTRKGKDPNAPFVREKLSLPGGHNKLLLHSCCAPCSGEVMEAILASKYSSAKRVYDSKRREYSFCRKTWYSVY